MKARQRIVVNKSYTRKELAMIYFDELSPKSASQCFTREMEKDKELKADLCLIGYRDSQRIFFPNQVQIIVNHWGNPDGLPIEVPKSYR